MFTVGCHCLPSVNTICGRIRIGLSLLSSISKHNMWSYYDNNDNPIIIRPHIVFTGGRHRHPNHNTTTYCVYWWTTTSCCRLSVNTICCRIMIGLSLSSASKHNRWSYYDWVVVVVIIRPHIVFTDGRQKRQPNDNTTTYCVYWRTTTTINPIIISFLSSVSKHNMWSYYDWVVVVVVCQ
jgi:hypothetical protein